MHPALLYAPLVALSFVQLWRSFSRRAAAIFLALALLTSGAGEWFGLTYGLFGVHYRYEAGTFGPLLAPILWACVPWLWFAFMLPAWLLARRTVAGDGFAAALARAFVAAWLMCAWDAMLDPWSVQHGYWTWERERALFLGIPQANFAAWLIGTFATFAIFEAFTRGRAAPRIPSRWAILPFAVAGAAYALEPLPLLSRAIAVIFVVCGLAAAATGDRADRGSLFHFGCAKLPA
jgi:putative membrane protein